MAGPFFFAWVDPGATTFGPEHHIEDESILDFVVDHAEGDFASLTIRVKNPQIGLLAPGRKSWAWFSWRDDDNRVGGGSGIVYPIFFGQLVGIPTDMIARSVTLKFIARSLTYVADKQRAVEPLKAGTGYDPIFVPLEKRDDPIAILEGYSSRLHFDRITLAASVSDVLVGEDGTVTFEASAALFNSLKVTPGQQPLTAVAINARVDWTQESIGTIDMGAKIFDTYSGDGLMNDWPKPLASLGGGWSCFVSAKQDVYDITNALTASYSYNYQNNESKHVDGDIMSISTSVTSPQLASPVVLSCVIKEVVVIGVVDPFAVDFEGNPAPLNVPASAYAQLVYVPQWRIAASMVLRYDAKRPRSEYATILLKSNLQPILANPTVTQDSELISKTGNVGEPIFNLLNWSSIAGQAVTLDQFIFPDNPVLPGQTSTQVCTTPGIAGTVEPAFSMIEGETTIDGAAVWTSLGTTPPPAIAPDWSKETNVPLGQVIIPRVPFYTTWSALVAPGLAMVPQIGAQISFGQVVRTTNGSYQICILGGITALKEPTFSGTWGIETLDGTVEWQSLGLNLADGSTAFMVTTPGETGTIPPPFNGAKGATTSDNGVVWTSLGQIEIPVGGYPGHILASSFFDTDRGLQALRYLIAIGRARLRLRARAVNVSWNCFFERAIFLSCRMNAAVFDPRLPGGQAAGKIIAYQIRGSGKRGKLIGNVTIGCSIGYGEVIHDDPGTPTYVDEGYFDTGDVQVYSGETILIDPMIADVGYSRPVNTPVDDGLVFPLTRAQVVAFEATHGTLAAQEAGILSAFQTAQNVTLQEDSAKFNYGAGPRSVSQSLQLQELQLQAQQNSVQFQLSQNPIWYDLQLKPVVNGPFSAEYNITVTDLAIPMTIDLAAASSL